MREDEDNPTEVAGPWWLIFGLFVVAAVCAWAAICFFNGLISLMRVNT